MPPHPGGSLMIVAGEASHGAFKVNSLGNLEGADAGTGFCLLSSFQKTVTPDYIGYEG